MLQNIINTFNKINHDCEQTGESVVPLTKDNVDYYIEQMENIGYSDKAIQLFEQYLLQH